MSVTNIIILLCSIVNNVAGQSIVLKTHYCHVVDVVVLAILFILKTLRKHQNIQLWR